MTDLLLLADHVLAGAAAGEDVEVYAVHRVATTVQAGTGGVVRQVVRAETRGLSIRLVADHRVGYASTSDLGPEALASALDRARANARLSNPDGTDQLPMPAEQPVAPLPSSDRLAAVPLQDKVELVSRLARLITERDLRVTGIDTAEYHDARAEATVVSTRGVRVQQVHEYAELWGDALAEDEHGRANDYASWWGRDPADVDVEALAAQAAQRAVRLLGPIVRVDRALPVVLDREVVATLLTAVGKACTGGALASGRSPFARSAGDPGASCVTLLDDGTALDSPAASAYDDEGVPRRRTELITAGRLAGALHSTSTALGTGGGARSTGNARRSSYKNPPRAAPTALRLAPTTDRQALLTDVGDAVHVQQLSSAGTGINAVTGRVDVGCVGWLLRDGVPVGRIASTPLSSSLPAVLRAVQAIADDARHVPGTPVSAPTVLCDGRLLWGP